MPRIACRLLRLHADGPSCTVCFIHCRGVHDMSGHGSGYCTLEITGAIKRHSKALPITPYILFYAPELPIELIRTESAGSSGTAL
jgi:hypothetical protein